MMRTRRAALVVLIAAVGITACDDPIEPYVPEPGTLALMLTTPHPDDGALMVRITGPETIGAVTPAPGLSAFSRTTTDETLAAAFGPIESGVLLRFAVPDVRRADEYSAALVEAADRQHALRGATSGYGLAIAR